MVPAGLEGRVPVHLTQKLEIDLESLDRLQAAVVFMIAGIEAPTRFVVESTEDHEMMFSRPQPSRTV